MASFYEREVNPLVQEVIKGEITWNFTATTSAVTLIKTGKLMHAFIQVIEQAADSSTTATTNAFIPAGYRPPNQITREVSSRDNGQSWTNSAIIDIKTDGTVEAFRTTQRGAFSATTGIRGVGHDPNVSTQRFTLEWLID